LFAWLFGFSSPGSAQTVAPPNSVLKAGNVYGLASGNSNVGTGNVAGGYFGNGSGVLFDVATTNGTGAGNQLFVFQSNGDGSFSLPASGLYNFGTAVQDGLNLIVAGPVVSPTSKDLVVTDDRGSLYLLKGNGDGTFQAPLSLSQTASTLSSYLNSSGTLNLVASYLTFPTTTTTQSIVNVLTNKNDGSGTFTSQSVPIPVNLSVNQASPLSAGGATALFIVYAGGTAALSQSVNGTFQAPVSLGNNGTPSGMGAGAISSFTWKGNTFLAGIATFGAGPAAYVWAVSGGSGGIGIGNSPSVYSIPTNDAVYVTTADLDGDGNVDLIVLGGGQFSTKQTVNLFLSGSANGFAPPQNFGTPNEILGPAVYGTEALVADVNGDGKNDLVLYESSQGLTVLLNQGSGAFLTPTTYAAGNTPRSIAKADFNGDGIDDLVVANGVNSATSTSDNTVSVFVSKAAGTFASQVIYPTGTNPVAVTTGKVNGNQSIFVLSSADTTGNFSNPVVAFLQGKGDGTFQPPVYFSTGSDAALGAQPLSIAAGAFDASGNSTVAVGNNDGTINLFTFVAGAFVQGTTLKATSAAPAFGLNLSSLAVADMNGDGNLDLVATLRGQCGYNLITGQNTLSGGAVLIFAGNGAGAFQSPVAVTANQATFDPASVSLGSLVNATRTDMLVVDAKASGDPCSAGVLAIPNPIVFTNGGNLTFAETDLAAQFGGVSSNPQTLPEAAIADVNGDGANDLVFSQNGLVSALLNSGTGTFTSTPTIYVGSSSSAGLVTGSFFGPGDHDVALASSAGAVPIQGMSAALGSPAHLVLDGNSLSPGVVGLTLTDGSPVTATNVRITGTLPAGVQFVSGGLPSVPCSSVSATQIVCTLSSLAPLGNPGVIPVTFTAPQSGIYTIAFNATSDEPEGIPPSDALFSIALQILVPQAHLVIDGNLVTQGILLVNTNVTVGLILANAGPATATNVKLVGNLPPGLTFVSGGTAAVPCSVFGSQILCTVSTFATSANFGVIPITLTTSQPATYDIPFSVTSDQPEGIPPSDAQMTIGLQINPLQADLAPSVVTMPSISFQNNNLTYLFTVTNNGPSNVTNARISFSIPTSALFVSVTPGPSGSCSLVFTLGLWVCNLGPIPFGSSASFSLVVTPTLVGPLTAKFSVSADQLDIDPITTLSVIVPINPSIMINEPITVRDQVFVTQLSGIAAPVASFSTSSLGFGSVAAGQTGTQILTVSDVGQSSTGLLLSNASILPTTTVFSIGPISCSNGATSLPTTLPTGGVCMVTISYTAPAAGPPPSAALTFTDNAALSNLTSTPVTGGYTQSISLNGSGTTAPTPVEPPSTIPININETIQVTDTPVVSNTQGGTNVTVTPVDTTTGTTPVTLMFTNVTQPGITTLTTSPTGPAPPPGFQPGNPAVYYNLSTTAIYTGSVTICINYAGILFTQPPHLYHYQNGAWMDVTNSVNTTNMIVCGTTTSFSPFALFQPAFAPTTTAVAAAGVSYGTSAGVMVSVGASGGPVTGSVSLSVDGGAASTMPLSSGSATFSLGVLSAGSHTLSASFAAQGNFLGSSAAGTLFVGQVPLTITANGSSRQYGGVDPAFTVSYSGFVNGDGPGSLSGKVTCTAGDTASSPVGNYTINCSGLSSTNYMITFVPGTLTVTRALLTVTANNATKTFNAPNPTFGWTASGFVNGENGSVLTATPTCTTTAITTSPVGSYSINCSGANAANYTFTYVPAKLKIVYATNLGRMIQPPINADGTSVFKQGRTIPAQFSVYDANGVSIGTPGVVTSFFLTGIVSGTVTTTVDSIVDTNNPDTAFRWDPTGQQWIFNITTGNLSAGSTYIYTITLNDGSTVIFQYGLR
jgi:uncharacterized repeat protein (TIGR01451 family)